MNLKQLEAFVQVAEGGSFSKAAKQLFLTQPTISAHISSLEKELNARLFVRNTKEVKLSDDGKDLYRSAKGIEQCIGVIPGLSAEIVFEEIDHQIGGRINGTVNQHNGDHHSHSLIVLN